MAMAVSPSMVSGRVVATVTVRPGMPLTGLADRHRLGIVEFVYVRLLEGRTQRDCRRGAQFLRFGGVAHDGEQSMGQRIANYRKIARQIRRQKPVGSLGLGIAEYRKKFLPDASRPIPRRGVLQYLQVHYVSPPAA